MGFLRWLWGWCLCKIGHHDWTSKAEQGIKPSEDELPTDDPDETIRRFWKYATMYCQRCDKKYVSLDIETRMRLHNEA